MDHAHSHVNGKPNGSEMSLDEELGIPSTVTLGARRNRHALKPLGVDSCIHKSIHVKYLINRLRYDGFLIHHYAYML